MNTKTENTVESKESKGKIESYLKGLIETKKDGEVTLTELSKQAKELSRHDLLTLLRGFGHGTVVIAGRKGAVSRMAFGASAASFLKNRNVNQKPHNTRKHRQTAIPNIGNYSLQLSLNGKPLTTIKLDAQLIAA